MLFLEQLKQPIERHVFWDEQRWMQQLSQFNWPAKIVLTEKILDMDEADHMIQIALVNGQPRESGHRHSADDFIRRRIDIHCIQIDAWPHDIAHGAVTEAQRPKRQF